MSNHKFQVPLIQKNSYDWKLIHALNYLVGGITFPLGSVIYFDFFMNDIESQEIAGWLFTIGSFTFLIADIMEWNHYNLQFKPIKSIFDSSLQIPPTFFQKLKWRSIGINYFLNVIASILYLIGSVFFIPETHKVLTGELLFLYGCLLIMISQLWKIARQMFEGQGKVIQKIKSDKSSFFIDIAACFGGAFYFAGVVLFDQANHEPLKYVPAVILFCFGGLSFFTSALLLQVKYFFITQTKQKKIYRLEDDIEDQNDIQQPMLDKKNEDTEVQ